MNQELLSFLLLVALLLSGPVFLHRHFYRLVGFVLGVFGNAGLNLALKRLLLEPRPNADDAFFRVSMSMEKNRNNPWFVARHCGMPSGHAQLAGFVLVYVVLSTHQWAIWAFMAALTVTTCVQRVVSGGHTWLQVGVGLCVGMALGKSVYEIITRVLKRFSVQGVKPNSWPFGSILYN